MLKRLNILIENMERGFLLDSKGFTLSYGCIYSLTYKEAKRNLNALKHAVKIFDECFLDITNVWTDRKKGLMPK